MVPVSPDGPAPAESTFHRPRHANGQAPNTLAERLPVIRFHDQVKMVVLCAEMENPEAPVGGRGERAANRREHPCGSKTADEAPGAERQVHGVRGDVGGPHAMRDSGPAARR